MSLNGVSKTKVCLWSLEDAQKLFCSPEVVSSVVIPRVSHTWESMPAERAPFSTGLFCFISRAICAVSINEKIWKILACDTFQAGKKRQRLLLSIWHRTVRGASEWLGLLYITTSPAITRHYCSSTVSTVEQSNCFSVRICKRCRFDRISELIAHSTERAKVSK